MAGTEIDVHVRPGDSYDLGGGISAPGVALFLQDGRRYALVEGYGNRLLVFDVGGEAVIIAIEALESNLPQLLAVAEPVASSLRFPA